jgi:hypothetical protein
VRTGENYCREKGKRLLEIERARRKRAAACFPCFPQVVLRVSGGLSSSSVGLCSLRGALIIRDCVILPDFSQKEFYDAQSWNPSQLQDCRRCLRLR